MCDVLMRMIPGQNTKEIIAENAFLVYEAKITDIIDYSIAFPL